MEVDTRMYVITGMDLLSEYLSHLPIMGEVCRHSLVYDSYTYTYYCMEGHTLCRLMLAPALSKSATTSVFPVNAATVNGEDPFCRYAITRMCGMSHTLYTDIITPTFSTTYMHM